MLWFSKVRQSEAERYVFYQAKHEHGLCVATAFGFDTDSAVLHPSHHVVLRNYAKHFEAGRTYLEIFARTDRSGSAAHNLGLSRRRAAEVRKQLVACGVPAGALFGFYCRALGERFEVFARIPDHARYLGGRSVWLFAWPSHPAYADGAKSSLGPLVDFGRRFGEAA